MRDLLTWNVSLGRWADVQVRLHVSFLVLIMAVLHLGTGLPEDRSPAPALAGLTILFLSVVAHELGHCLAAWKCGGRIDRVVLAPWGGLTYVAPSRDLRCELFTALAGPAVNGAVCVIAVLTLVGLRVPIARLFQPFDLPAPANPLSTVAVITLVAWINWLIVLVNLLPAYPLDGARAVRAVLRPRLGFRSAVVHTWRAGILVAAALWIAAWYLHDPFNMASLACSLLGIFLYFSSWQEAERLHEPDAGLDVDGFDDRFDDAETEPRAGALLGPLRRWLRQRRQERLLRQLQQERDEEDAVDQVLARLHALGPQALSAEDRALLQRVSARYRKQQRVNDR